MPDDMSRKTPKPRRFHFLRVPLFRLLAINLAVGTALAVLLVGGLSGAQSRRPARSDSSPISSPGTALGLLLFGFVVTFGSTAMGTAIMVIGQPRRRDEPPRGRPRLATQEVAPGGHAQLGNIRAADIFSPPPAKPRGGVGGGGASPQFAECRVPG